MKLTRKLASLMLVLIFVIGTIGVPASAETFTDIEDSDYAEDIQLLYDLGVVKGKTDGEYYPDDTLTRAEYATIVLRLLGVEGGIAGKDIFTDVPQSHWAYANITAAYDMGLVNGMGNGIFAPDAAVTYQQAAKMLVCALGYGGKAEAKGGFPNGYTAVAAELKITERVGFNHDGGITRAEMAAMVANSLDIEMYSHEKYDYGLNEGESFLSYMNVEKYEGQITANYMTSLGNVTGLDKDQVAMGDLVFECGNTNAASFLGKRVVLYARTGSDVNSDGQILSIAANKYIDQLIVPATDILPDTTTGRLSYYERGTTEKSGENIAAGAILVYNGVKKDPWTAEDLKPVRGSVTLVMNNGGCPDVIFVNEYKNYIVNAINVEDEKIYLMSNGFGKNELVLEQGDGTVAFLFTDMTGEQITVADCKKWDVLSVAENEDGTIMSVIRSNLKIEGAVTQVSDDYVYIDDIDYEVTSDIESMPLLRDEGTFYLDYNGFVAHFEKGSVSAEKYAWLINMATSGSISSKLEVKLYTEDDEILYTQTSSKVTVDDSRYDSGEMYSGKETALFEGGAVKPQLIKFRLNAAGDVTEIDTATGYETDYYNDARLNEFSRDLYIDTDGNANGEGVIYSAGSLGSFASRYLIRSQTKIFSIPSTDADEDYSIISNKSLIHNGGYTNVSLYDTDEDSVVSVMVWQRTGAMDATPDKEMAQALVTRAYTKRDAEGEYKYALACIDTKGKPFDLLVDDDFKARAQQALTDIKKDEDLWVKPAESYPPVLEDRVDVSLVNPGDVIQYQIVEGKVTCINILFRGQTPGDYDHICGDYGVTPTPGREYFDRGDMYAGYGEVKSVSQYAAKVEVKDKANPDVKYERAFVMDAVNPILYDFDTKDVRQISYEMIYPGDKILSTREQRYQRFVIVYRNAPDVPESENLPQIQPGDVVPETELTGDKLELTTDNVVKASGSASSNEKEYILDKNTNTRWQSNSGVGEEKYVIVDLCGETTVTGIGLQMFSGTRDYPFWIEVAGEDGNFRPLVGSSSSPLANEKTSDMAYYSLGEESGVRFVKYCGTGPAEGGGAGYVQITEMEIYGEPVTAPDTPRDPTAITPPAGGGGGGSSTTPEVGDIVTTPTGTEFAQASITVTDDSELPTASKPAENALDGDSSSYWESNSGTNKNILGTIIFDLDETKTVSEIELEWFNASRAYNFCIQVSTDGTTWTNISNMGTPESKDSMITSTAKKACYYLGNVEARYIKYLGFGNSANKYNQLCEFKVYIAQ